MGKAIVAKAKATLPDITVESGAESTIVQNADLMSPVENVQAQNVETLNSETTTMTESNEEKKEDL